MNKQEQTKWATLVVDVAEKIVEARVGPLSDEIAALSRSLNEVRFVILGDAIRTGGDHCDDGELLDLLDTFQRRVRAAAKKKKKKKKKARR